MTARLFNKSAWCSVAIVVLTLTSFSASARAETTPHYQIWGYYPYWIKDEWQKIDLSIYDRILFFEVQVSAGQRITQTYGWPESWEELISTARKNGVQLQPVFSLFDVTAFERIFSSRKLRKLLQTEMLALLDKTDAGGLQLDFEFFGAVSKTSSDGYKLFLKSIRQELAARQLSLFVLTEDAAGLYDSDSLANADYIIIQGYDAHWKGSTHAGPVAELHGSSPDSWDSSLEHYLALKVPRGKILMSVPFFGYEWPTKSDAAGTPSRGTGREISFAQLSAGLVPEIETSALERIRQYGIRRDPTTKSPYYVFKDETGWHQGWFEDETSLSAKFEFVKDQRLAGIAVFPLGYDGGKFEPLLRSHFRPAANSSGNSYNRRETSR
jgi:spore germination protein YaaH